MYNLHYYFNNALLTIGTLFKKKVIAPVAVALRSGTSSKEISFTVTLGVIFGVLPVFGINSFLLLLIALRWKLNIVIIQAVNYLVYPLQFLLFLPFVRMGQWIYTAENAPQTISAFLEVASEKWLLALTTFGVAISWAVLSWLLLSVPVGYALFQVILFVLKKQRSTPTD